MGISVIATSHGGGRGRGDIEFAAGVFEYAIVFFVLSSMALLLTLRVALQTLAMQWLCDCAYWLPKVGLVLAQAGSWRALYVQDQFAKCVCALMGGVVVPISQ